MGWPTKDLGDIEQQALAMFGDYARMRGCFEEDGGREVLKDPVSGKTIRYYGCEEGSVQVMEAGIGKLSIGRVPYFTHEFKTEKFF